MLRIIIASIVVLLILLCTVPAWIAVRMLLHPRSAKKEEKKTREERIKGFSEEYYESLDRIELTIKSSYGYDLHGVLLENEKTRQKQGKKKLAILCHGYTSLKEAMVPYAKNLLDLGYAVLIYDHRNHGVNEKSFTSMGFYETKDLFTVIDFCKKRYNNSLFLLLYGESMGAATVLNALSKDNNVKGVIADCPYSDLTTLIRYQIRHFYHLPACLVVPFINLLLKKKAGFTMKEVSPIQSISKHNVPILFIHGKKDTYVPYQMSIDMEKSIEGQGRLYLVDGAAHAQSIRTQPEEYKHKVTEFIQEIEQQNGEYNGESV